MNWFFSLIEHQVIHPLRLTAQELNEETPLSLSHPDNQNPRCERPIRVSEWAFGSNGIKAKGIEANVQLVYYYRRFQNKQPKYKQVLQIISPRNWRAPHRNTQTNTNYAVVAREHVSPTHPRTYTPTPKRHLSPNEKNVIGSFTAHLFKSTFVHDRVEKKLFTEPDSYTLFSIYTDYT